MPGIIEGMLSRAVWPKSDIPNHNIDRDNQYIKY